MMIKKNKTKNVITKASFSRSNLAFEKSLEDQTSAEKIVQSSFLFGPSDGIFYLLLPASSL